MDKPWTEATAEAVEFYQLGNYKQALDGFTESVRLARQSEAQPLELGELLHNLSIAQFALSKFPEVQSTLAEALALVDQADAGGPENPSDAARSLRACLLNARARLHSEFEAYEQAEADLLTAAALVEPIHPAYAADILGNLIRTCASLSPWRHKIAPLSIKFERLHRLDEQVEIYYDLISGWRRPGLSWDREGSPAPEVLEARLLALKASYAYESKQGAQADFLAILRIDEETRVVPPHIVVFAHQALAEIAFHQADYLSGARHSQNAISAANNSFLRSQPANYENVLKGATYSLLSTTAEKTREMFDSAAKMVVDALGEINTHYLCCAAAKALVLPLLSTHGGDPAKEQEELLRKCTAIDRKLYPDNHCRVIALQTALADVCIKQNHLAEAESILTSALQHAQNSFLRADMMAKCYRSFADLAIKQKHLEAARDYLQKQETLIAEQNDLIIDSRLQLLSALAQQYDAAALPKEAVRVLRQVVALAASLSPGSAETASKLLALTLMKCGLQAEAAEVLAKKDHSDRSNGDKLSKREKLVEQSREAWGLHTEKKFAEAYALAEKVVREAHLLMPECEEALVMAASILVEQAKIQNKPDEMVNLIGVLGDYQNSIRLRCTLPTFYLQAAQSYAALRSVKADVLFEQAVTMADDMQAIIPQSTDACCFAYMTYCLSSGKKEKALQLCERLLVMRSNSAGIDSAQYADILSSKADLLSDTDISGADHLSAEALAIREKLWSESATDGPAQMTRQLAGLGLYVALASRYAILQKLLRFDESNQLQTRMTALKEQIKELVAK